MVVVSISLSGKALADFDHLVDHFGYDSRSSAVRDALHHYVAQHRFQFREGETDVVLTLLYSADAKQDKVRQVLHDHESLIRTNLHQHLGAQCVDVLVVHGSGKDVHGLIDGLTRLKDVRVNTLLIGGEADASPHEHHGTTG